jgi:CubicO group peptidase (beta-lactamase class C family)
MTGGLMRGFPPPAADQVTLANWREPPFNRWAFHHVREVVPTARIAHDPANAAIWPGTAGHSDVLGLAFGDPGGVEWTIGDLLPDSFSDGLIVLHKRTPVLEWAAPTCEPDAPHIIFSVSKSLTATLAGVLVADGLIDPDKAVTHYIPEAAGSAYGDCTVRHVLDMSVGIDFEDSYLDKGGAFDRYRQATGWNPIPAGVAETDLRSFLVTLPRDSHTHGEMFHYVSPNSDLLGWIIERASGVRFADLFSERIWKPLRAAGDGYVTVDRLGAPRTAGGICVSLRDLARFGEMIRQGGAANARQVVPQDWIDDINQAGSREAWSRGAMADLFPNGRYRSNWYQTGNGRGAICAIGIHGQWIYIDPVSEMTIVRSASQPLPLDDPRDLRWIAAFDAIARAFG